MLERWTTAAARCLSRLTGKDVRAREVRWLIGLMVLGLAIRVAYVLLTEGYALAGDQREYDVVGRAAAAGNWFHTDVFLGELRESAARPPGYMLWIGVLYTTLGISVTKALLVQTLIGPVVIALVWILARRLFDSRVAVVAAALAAVHPNLWQWEGRLYSEALVLPISVLTFILVLERRPTPKLAAGIGVVAGLSLLVRPSQVFVFLMVLVAFALAAGVRRSVALTALSALVAALVVAPWTIRNHVVTDAFVPISLQDSALGGTFNDDAANDPIFPYAWRPVSSRDKDLFEPGAVDEIELRDELQSRALDFIEEHPFSVAEAFFWNGISRTWDLRSPSRVLDEVPFEGREDPVAAVGLAVYWLLLIGALATVWRLRRARRTLVWPVLAGAAGMSVVFTVAAASRYRVPFEPLVVLLSAASFVAWFDGLRARRSAPGGQRPEGGPQVVDAVVGQR